MVGESKQILKLKRNSHHIANAKSSNRCISQCCIKGDMVEDQSRIEDHIVEFCSEPYTAEISIIQVGRTSFSQLSNIEAKALGKEIQ